MQNNIGRETKRLVNYFEKQRAIERRNNTLFIVGLLVMAPIIGALVVLGIAALYGGFPH